VEEVVNLAVPGLRDPMLERCADGDQQAWEGLYAAYADTARRFLYRLGVEPSALDDTCQEVFLQAFRYLPQFQQKCSFQTWLYRLCVTQAGRSRKKSQGRSHLESSLEGVSSDEPTYGDLSHEQTERLLQTGINGLKAPEREVFVLYEIEGVPGREIADIVGRPESTIWRMLHYARRDFRAAIANGGMNQ